MCRGTAYNRGLLIKKNYSRTKTYEVLWVLHWRSKWFIIIPKLTNFEQKI